MPYQTILIEDQGLFRSLLASHLAGQSDFELIGEAVDGEAGLQLFKELHPDLILLDIVIPKLDGFTVAERILQQAPSANILAITSQMDETTTNRISEIGFKGYVEKEQPIEVLQEAMLTVAEGGFYFTRLVRENRYKLSTDPAAIRKIMSERELEILIEVARGLKSQDIADQFQISRRTVENHRYRIMKKLNLDTTSELVMFAIKQGFIQP